MDDRPLSADRVPTLTEVVELDLPAGKAGPPADTAPDTAPDTAAQPQAADAPLAVHPPVAIEPAAVLDAHAGSAQASFDVLPETSPAAPNPPAVAAEVLVGQVLAELQPRIDMLLEARLREALAPALARVADGLVRDTRDGLTEVLRELVQDAVDRALQRRADR